MNRSSLGRHLYSQIVLPLVVASLIVGLVATVAAVYFLSDLTEKWIDQVAGEVTSSLESRLGAHADSMLRAASVMAESTVLADSIASGDPGVLSEAVARLNESAGFSGALLLDADGAAVAAAGEPGVEAGDRPLGSNRLPAASGPGVSFVRVSDALSMAAFQPVTAGDARYTLVLYEPVDATFLDRVTGDSGVASALYDADGELVASAASDGEAASEAQAEIEAALAEDTAPIGSTLAAADEGSIGHGTLTIGDQRFHLAATRLSLDGDATGSHVYAATVISQAVTDEARTTTTNLITIWSMFAVLALVGLGGWVARRVSDPLVELTEGARRISDGDFSTKIHVSGANEIAGLAVSFNAMMDSLRDRSESLTKKVLELATLYEMSRALGSTLEMDVLLESVLDSALRIFGVELGYVTLRDRETGKLELMVWRGADARADEQALNSSMSEWVVREGRPLIFNPTRGGAEERVDSVTGALAALCVPLVSAEGPLGSITVGSHDASFRFTSDDVRLLSTIANHVTIAIGNIELFSSLQDAYLSTVRSLAAAVDAKDPFTRGHSDRVAQYAISIAQRMGLSHEQRVALEMAAYLHDIGKIGVKEEILLKPGKLTEAEMGQMRHHPLIGANILKPVGFPWPITPVVRHHHERWDGAGYPAGLRGEETPLLARILTVADAFEAMIADRPYRLGRTVEDAVEELRRCAGSHFDPKIVDVFIEIIREQELAESDKDLFSAEDIQPEEALAIFVALCDGMFSSFRKLGGPRLASNIEEELNQFFEETEMPFAIIGGRVSRTRNGDGSPEVDLDQMRLALRRVDSTMGRMSGHTLVDHFYTDAMEGLSERMRSIASHLEFYGR